MPDYLAPRHGVSISQAMAEAAAIAPIGRVMLNTFELYDPIGTPDGPVYLVNARRNFTATKEAGADRDPGAVVEFQAISLIDQRPEESDQASAPQVQLTAGNVSGIVSDLIRARRGSIRPMEIIERIYAADDPSGPAQLPALVLLVSNVDLDGEVATMTAGYGDPASVSVPTITLKRLEYPGLVR